MSDFRSRDTWQIFRIMAEFVEGFETLGPHSIFANLASEVRKLNPHGFCRSGLLFPDSLFVVALPILPAGEGLRSHGGEG